MTTPTPPPIFDADELRRLAVAAESALMNDSYGVGTKRVRALREQLPPRVVLALLDERATLLAIVEAAEAERDTRRDNLTRCHEHGRNLVLQNVAQGKDRDEWRSRAIELQAEPAAMAAAMIRLEADREHMELGCAIAAAHLEMAMAVSGAPTNADWGKWLRAERKRAGP